MSEEIFFENRVNEKEAAEILGVAIKTLQRWRCVRKGPAYIKIGRKISYMTIDLNIYIEKKRINPSA